MADIDKKDYSYPQTGDPKLGQWIFSKFKIAKNEKDRLNMHAKWLRNYELKRGRHWRNKDKKYPLVPINIFYSAIRHSVALLTDNKPKFDIIPHDEKAETMAPIINTAAATWYKRTKQQLKLTSICNISETYGTAIREVVFDPSLEAGIGDTDTVTWDAFAFYPWPGILEIQDMPFFFTVKIMELADIIRLYPEQGMKVEADKEYSSYLGKDREEVKAGSLAKYGSTSGNLPTNYVEAGAGFKEGGLERAMVITAWLKDYTTVKEIKQQPIVDTITGQPILDEIGNPVMENIETEKFKYPGNIRRIRFVNQGRIVLEDTSNPSINPNIPEEKARNTFLWDKYPFTKMDSNTDEANFWGYSVIEQIEILGMEINKKISQIAAYIDKTVRPPLILPKTCGIDDNEISNLPGQRWRPINHVVAAAIRYMQVPPLPSDFYNYLNLLMKLIDIITGITDVTEGRKPAGVQAASAIVALQEKAETIFREKIRNLDVLNEQTGMMWISMMQNWYTETRTLQLSGKLVEQYGQFTDYTGSQVEGEFSFEVVSGSTMPKSLWVRKQDMIQLLQYGAIDQEAILDEFDIPRKEEILRRMQLGVVGQALQKLQIAGLPPQVLQTIGAILSMPEKQFQKAFQQPQEKTRREEINA